SILSPIVGRRFGDSSLQRSKVNAWEKQIQSPMYREQEVLDPPIYARQRTCHAQSHPASLVLWLRCWTGGSDSCRLTRQHNGGQCRRVASTHLLQAAVGNAVDLEALVFENRVAEPLVKG